MRIAVWSPLPPADSEVADHTRDLLPALAARHDVVAVVEDPEVVDRSVVPGILVVGPSSVPATDLDVYQIANSRMHAYIYRAALERPGVVVLHEWVLHDLVWHEAASRNDVSSYLREMRRSDGAAGSFVGRQVSRGTAGFMLPKLFAANDHLIQRSLGIVTLTREAAGLLESRRMQAPRLHLPQHVSLPEGPQPSRAEARRDLGLPEDALLVTAPALPGASTDLEALARAVERLRSELPRLCLVVAGEEVRGLLLQDRAREADLGPSLVVTGRLSAPDLVRQLVAADVVSALRFPSRGEMPALVLRALGVGRPVLVTAGTPAAEEMPEGVVVPVDPGSRQLPELVALLRLLLTQKGLRETIGALARNHARAHHGPQRSAALLGDLLDEVERRRTELLGTIEVERREDPIVDCLVDEVRLAARALGLEASSLGLERGVRRLADRGRSGLPRSD